MEPTSSDVEIMSVVSKASRTSYVSEYNDGASQASQTSEKYDGAQASQSSKISDGVLRAVESEYKWEIQKDLLTKNSHKSDYWKCGDYDCRLLIGYKKDGKETKTVEGVKKILSIHLEVANLPHEGLDCDCQFTLCYFDHPGFTHTKRFHAEFSTRDNRHGFNKFVSVGVLKFKAFASYQDGELKRSLYKNQSAQIIAKVRLTQREKETGESIASGKKIEDFIRKKGERKILVSRETSKVFLNNEPPKVKPEKGPRSARKTRELKYEETLQKVEAAINAADRRSGKLPRYTAEEQNLFGGLGLDFIHFLRDTKSEHYRRVERLRKRELDRMERRGDRVHHETCSASSKKVNIELQRKHKTDLEHERTLAKVNKILRTARDRGTRSKTKYTIEEKKFFGNLGIAFIDYLRKIKGSKHHLYSQVAQLRRRGIELVLEHSGARDGSLSSGTLISVAKTAPTKRRMGTHSLRSPSTKKLKASQTQGKTGNGNPLREGAVTHLKPFRTQPVLFERKLYIYDFFQRRRNTNIKLLIPPRKEGQHPFVIIEEAWRTLTLKDVRKVLAPANRLGQLKYSEEPDYECAKVEAESIENFEAAWASSEPQNRLALNGMVNKILVEAPSRAIWSHETIELFESNECFGIKWQIRKGMDAMSVQTIEGKRDRFA